MQFIEIYNFIAINNEAKSDNLDIVFKCNFQNNIIIYILMLACRKFSGEEKTLFSLILNTNIEWFLIVKNVLSYLIE